VLIKYRFDRIILSLLSSATTIFILFLIFDKELSADFAFAGIILASTLTIGIVDHTSIQGDFKAGILEQFFLLPISNIKIVVIRLVSASIQYSVLHIPLWLILYYCVSGEIGYKTSTIYLLFIVNLNTVSVLIHSVSLSIRQNKGMLSSILTVPILLPQIILSLLALGEVLYLLASLILSIIMIPLCIIFSTFLIQSVIREDS
jgi:hypothetical protein